MCTFKATAIRQYLTMHVNKKYKNFRLVFLCKRIVKKIDAYFKITAIRWYLKINCWKIDAYFEVTVDLWYLTIC